ncbi:MAG: prepilin-type N-terminal cleavage/methylation domain-containing protein [Thermoguttaceae bacterium]|nr:prepilin-type N-terminal cleavage/methylation domain-containing protein [Thermoguttaceae bacterium]
MRALRRVDFGRLDSFLTFPETFEAATSVSGVSAVFVNGGWNVFMRRAFTLLELLIVLALILIVSGISVASFQRMMTRSRFKAGVVEIQIDLHRARLLAMQTGTPYIFRYAPGSGVYEIAPLNALQEAVYRQNDATDLTDAFGDDALGGSLSETAFGTENAATGFATEAGLYAVAGEYAAPIYSDDLFSPANVAADMEALGLGTANNFGGGFDAAFADPAAGDPTLAADFAFGDPNFSTSGGNATFAIDPTTGATTFANATPWRELTTEEKALVSSGSVLAWRVGPDGAIVRKTTTGDAIFTFMRVSASTPLNLKTRRSTGLERTEEEATDDALGDGTFESRLTGSLAAPPELAEDSPFAVPKLRADATVDGALGGDLAGLESALGLDSTATNHAASSVWSEPIVFYPNGRVSSAVFGIACVGAVPYYSEIAIRGMTGVARISSISTLSPEADPAASALTQEQLFRLSNPFADATTNPDGTPSAADGTETALNADAAGTPVDALWTPGAADAVGEATSGLDAEFDASGTERRSGYRFDVPTSDPLAPTQNSPASTENFVGEENGFPTNAGGIL